MMECRESISWEPLRRQSVSTGVLTAFLLLPAYPPFKTPAQKTSSAALDTSSPLHLHKTARSTPLLKYLQWLPTTKIKFKFHQDPHYLKSHFTNIPNMVLAVGLSALPSGV